MQKYYFAIDIAIYGIKYFQKKKKKDKLKSFIAYK